MSVAALQSVELDAVLREGSARLAQRFFARSGRVVDVPWSIAAGNDLRMPEATGRRSACVNLINWYMAKLHRAAHHDATLALAFHNVANLLATPMSVMNPGFVLRVLLAHLRRSGNRSRALGGFASCAQQIE